MSQIPFSVSARTALLIGQQNFTNAEGAIIELVKNTYDADAKYCLVLFDIPFAEIPEILSGEQVSQYQLESMVENKYYSKVGDEYFLDKKIKETDSIILKSFLNQHNRICIVDSGVGMTRQIISDQWMTIGTGNKDKKVHSGGGRVQTGAKGIGRFALDRLGRKARLWTVPKETGNWEMDWTQFEKADLKLSDVKATVIDAADFDLNRTVQEIFSGFPFYQKLPKDAFNHGTFIQIENVRDEWTSKEIAGVFKGLESLIPPKDLKIPFQVYQGYNANPKLFGEVETAFFNDYDYKLVANYDAENLRVKFDITRNEIDLKELDGKYKGIYESAKFPFDRRTLAKKTFEVIKPVEQVIKWKKTEDNIDRLKLVGNFEFTFYFLKVVLSKKEKYPYKPINSSERQNTLARFGGIKIYRDSFRVRPYGDPDNDWLDLGRRAGRSPAGAGQRIGDWRVGSNQVAGLIQISRIKNEQLRDKSDRGALVENDAFNLFKRILTGIINEFEIDRSTVLHPIYLYNEIEEKRLEEERIQVEAEKLAEKIYEARITKERKLAEEKTDNNSGSKTEDSDPNSEKDTYQKLAEESIRLFQRPEERDAEIAQVRNLASLGLIMASFAHELRNVQHNTNEVIDLEKIYQKIASVESRGTKAFQNGLDILELLKADNQKVKHWVDYSLTSIKRDKRQRRELLFSDYFTTLSKDWKYPLSDRFITLKIERVEGAYSFRAFEMDMNTIFSNLITNSIDSFLSAKKLIDREISIKQTFFNDIIQIIYSDNGPGLPDVFANKEEVFLPFTTSKKDKDGQDIGTGLGMYLVKNVVLDYSGTVDILDVDKGFVLKIEFPTRKPVTNV